MTRVIWTVSVKARYDLRVMDEKTKRKGSPSPNRRGCPAITAIKDGPAPARPMGYEHWAVSRLRHRGPCRVEPGMSCIPLRDDPICMSCYDSYREALIKVAQ